MFSILPSTAKAITEVSKRGPNYKELEEVVVTGVRRPKPAADPMPMPHKRRRIMGMDEPVFYSILGLAALGGMIYVLRKK